MKSKNNISQPNVCLIVIGNEILSGRTNDKNINFIANRCNKIGLKLKEVRVIPDTSKIIQKVVKESSKKFDHVFTTGGIGPTHDDITAISIAKAFNRKLILNSEAKKRLENHYKKSNLKLNESRLKMAYIPDGADLIDNPVSAAPGFKIQNVWVLAGVPIIAKAMFVEYIEKNILRGTPTFSETINVKSAEGEIAKIMSKIQKAENNIEIGSYPYFRPPQIGTTIVVRGLDKKLVKNTIKLFINYFKQNNIEFLLNG